MVPFLYMSQVSSDKVLIGVSMTFFPVLMFLIMKYMTSRRFVDALRTLGKKDKTDSLKQLSLLFKSYNTLTYIYAGIVAAYIGWSYYA